jgi:hypothetical protein
MCATVWPMLFVRWPEKMITISGTNWFSRPLAAPANYTQYELIFQYLRVAAGIVKRDTAVDCRLTHRSSKSIPLASGRLAIVCMLANTPRYGVG